MVEGEPLVEDREYSVAMKFFVSQGKDGYDVLADCPYMVREKSWVCNFFQPDHILLMMFKGFSTWSV